MPRPRNFVTYYRVSTARQGRSGLGLDAQKSAVKSYLDAHGGNVLVTFTEIESGKHSDRPQLTAALLRCRQTRATLLIAKLDRLSRNASFLMGLRDSGVRFIAADLPDANELTVGVMALMAQQEREAISDRTVKALAEAKKRGTKLGNPNLAAVAPRTAQQALVASHAASAAAKARAELLRDVVEDARAQGAETLRTIAVHLTRLEIQTPRGSYMWAPASVDRLLKQLDIDLDA